MPSVFWDPAELVGNESVKNELVENQDARFSKGPVFGWRSASRAAIRQHALRGEIQISGMDSSLFRALEPFAALVAVALQRVEDDGICLARRTYLIDLNRFAFELLVILKESAQHEQAMRRHLDGLAVRVEL